MDVFGFESFCVYDDEMKNTETTTRIKKHNLNSFSIPFDNLEHPIVLRKVNPRNLVSSSKDAP